MIVFWTSTAAHGESLWIVDANGRHPRNVAHSEGGINPVFSPKGSQIAMVRKGALFVVDLDGSGRTLIVRQSTGVEGKIDWSPDGSGILFRDRNQAPHDRSRRQRAYAAHAWKVLLRVLLARRHGGSSCSATASPRRTAIY